MIYVGDLDTSLYQAKVPSDYDKAFQAFLRAYPAYAKTAVLDELRRREYGRLDDAGHIYLDYTGGGIANFGTLLLVNSTLSGNNAGGSGGGLSTIEGPAAHLYNVTIIDNTADADGLVGHNISAANSLIGGNSDNSGAGNQFHDCAGTLTSQGYNLVANVSGCNIVGDTTGNLVGVDPLLGPLQNNGGPTLSHALLDGSPAIDAGNPGGCPDHNGNLLTSDQRGFARPAAGSPFCDIGAYKAGAADKPTPTPTATAVPTITPTPSSWNYLPVIMK